MPILKLHGCSPEPLGNYLKALGVFRLVAEQADTGARAWWEDDVLNLATTLNSVSLQAFFLGQDPDGGAYSPAPLFAPWGGRPGFFKEGSNAGAKERLGLLTKAAATKKQLGTAAQALTTLREILESHQVWNPKTNTAETPWSSAEKAKKDKSLVMALCRNLMPSAFVDWMDACLALENDASFGILFGTGGNEGSADITNNFWQFVEQCVGFPEPNGDSPQWLASALFSTPRTSGLKETSGQLFPAAAKGENIGQGFTGSVATNPWDAILAMEGCILFAGAITKRLSQHGRGKAAFPFMLDHLTTGQPQEAARDEPQQDARKSKCKGEIFIPLWNDPLSLRELKALLAEGRLQGPGGNPAINSVQAFEAIAGLGVSSGIHAFGRVGFFERRGNVNIATTLEVVPVPKRRSGILPLIEELRPFRNAAFRNLREGPAVPARLLTAKQRLESAIAMALRDDCHELKPKKSDVQKILSASAILQSECSVTKSARASVSPCPPLTEDKWLSSPEISCLDNSTECNLALGLASILPWGESTQEARRPAVGALLTNLVPVVRQGKRWDWNELSRAAVWSNGAPLLTNLASVLRRRLIDAQSGKGEGLPLASVHPAPLKDLLALWRGGLDEVRLSELISALSLVDFGNGWDQAAFEARQAKQDATPTLAQSGVWFDATDKARLNLAPSLGVTAEEQEAAFALPRAYALLKLCFPGGRLPAMPNEKANHSRTGREPHPNPPLRLLNLLLAGRSAEALRVAAWMLRAKGYLPIVSDTVLATGEWSLSVQDSQRMAGLLLVPVRQLGVLAALSIKPQNI